MEVIEIFNLSIHKSLKKFIIYIITLTIILVTILNTKYNCYADFEKYIFKEQLTPNQLAVYEAISSFSAPCDISCEIVLPEPIFISKPYGYEKTLTATDRSEINFYVSAITRNAVQALMYDNLDFFWFNSAFDSVCQIDYKEDGIKVEKIEIPIGVNYLFCDGQEAMDVKNLLDYQVKTFLVTGSSRASRAYSIYQSIISKTSYSSKSKFSHSAIGVFLEPHYAVCDGYAKAFKTMCDYYDIPCILVGGTGSVSSERHIWCYVKLEDNEWYAVDPTWESSGDTKYFLKGSDNFFLTHIQFDTVEGSQTDLHYPEISAENYRFVNLYSTSVETNLVSAKRFVTSQYSFLPKPNDLDNDSDFSVTDIMVMKYTIIKN